jgi:hypothetical protein
MSATLKPNKIKPTTQSWLAESAESFSLMGALLAIIHPNLFHTGLNAFQKIINNPTLVKEGDAVLHILNLWTSPFSGYGLISNCTTPLHRDNNSQAPWYDFLTTIGPYSDCKLHLHNLGVELQYDSGTMVALLGKVIRHGTTEATGSRICIAQYMRDNVLERLGMEAPSWMTLADYGMVA